MDETALAQVRIILVQPMGPLNVGSVARVMKNMGLRQLVLVAPRCDRNEEQARKMAVHGIDILEAAQEVETLPEALVGCQRAIATTSRSRSVAIELEPPRTALPWLLEAGPSALIFGSEDQGLNNSQLQYAQRFVQIPASDTYTSLNLAQAVAVCCYELYQFAALEGKPAGDREIGGSGDQMVFNTFSPLEPSAPLEILEQYYQHLEALLLKIGYLYPHTAASRMAKFRLLFNRAQPSAAEVAMLRGILRQMEWALHHSTQYPEFNAEDQSHADSVESKTSPSKTEHSGLSTDL